MSSQQRWQMQNGNQHQPHSSSSSSSQQQGQQAAQSRARRRSAPLTYPWGHPHHGRPYIVVHEHDVLSGRGVNIAEHAGNKRFRALCASHQDADYCKSYSTSEKRALAQKIVKHIQTLRPPGRFLKRAGRIRGGRGLDGPWENLSDQEAIKKTMQALRDCNRQDRAGNYAGDVAPPLDVIQNQELRSKSGLTNRQYAQEAAAAAKKEEAQQMQIGKRPSAEQAQDHTAQSQLADGYGINAGGSFSPSIEHGAEVVKRLKANPEEASSSAINTPLPSNSTPTTMATSGGTLPSLQDTSAMLDAPFHPSDDHNNSPPSGAPAATQNSVHFYLPGSQLGSMPPSPTAPRFHDPAMTSGAGATSQVLSYPDTTFLSHPQNTNLMSMPPTGEQQQQQQQRSVLLPAGGGITNLNVSSGELDPLHFAAATIEGTMQGYPGPPSLFHSTDDHNHDGELADEPQFDGT